MEHGATRNFEAEKLIDQEEKRLQAKREADEANPMKVRIEMYLFVFVFKAQF